MSPSHCSCCSLNMFSSSLGSKDAGRLHGSLVPEWLAWDRSGRQNRRQNKDTEEVKRRQLIKTARKKLTHVRGSLSKLGWFIQTRTTTRDLECGKFSLPDYRWRGSS